MQGATNPIIQTTKDMKLDQYTGILKAQCRYHAGMSGKDRFWKESEVKLEDIFGCQLDFFTLEMDLVPERRVLTYKNHMGDEVTIDLNELLVNEEEKDDHALKIKKTYKLPQEDLLEKNCSLERLEQFFKDRNKRNFDKLDKNGNGALEHKEIMEWAKEECRLDGEEFTPQTVQEYYAYYDKNKTGKISKDDYCAVMAKKQAKAAFNGRKLREGPIRF